MMTTGARFSPCMRYRYRLWREWEPSLPTICFVMLNPSTADEVANDPTVERCQRRARECGYGRLEVVNIFALRSTDPDALKVELDPVGPENDDHIIDAASRSDVVVCAWGNHGRWLSRGSAVAGLLSAHGIDLHHLGITGGGHPRHPLYVPYSVKPMPWVLG